MDEKKTEEQLEADMRSLVEGLHAAGAVFDRRGVAHRDPRRQGLGLREADALVAQLRRIEAASIAAPGRYAGEGIRAARILRALYDCFAVSLLPEGHAAFATILAATARVKPARVERGH